MHIRIEIRCFLPYTYYGRLKTSNLLNKDEQLIRKRLLTDNFDITFYIHRKQLFYIFKKLTFTRQFSIIQYHKKENFSAHYSKYKQKVQIN